MTGGLPQSESCLGNLKGAVRRGRGGKEKEWVDCVQSDVRALVIARNWKATALETLMWVETGMESVRRFMAASRKEEVDAAKLRQEKRYTNEARKVTCDRTGKPIFPPKRFDIFSPLTK